MIDLTVKRLLHNYGGVVDDKENDAYGGQVDNQDHYEYIMAICNVAKCVPCN